MGESHDLHVLSNTMLLADASENFSSMCLEIYELDPAKFLSAPGLAWKTVFKNTKVKKGISRGICHSIYRYTKAYNKYMKDYDKNKKSSYIQNWDVNNLHDWAML